MEHLLIADHYPVIRLGLRLQLQKIAEEQERYYEIIEAGSLAEVLAILAGGKVSYAVLDMFFEDGSLLAEIDTLARLGKQIRILIYSKKPSGIYAQRFIAKGLFYLSKTVHKQVLVAAIRAFFKGKRWERSMEEYADTPERILPDDPIHTLSDSELLVAEYIAIGLPGSLIAQRTNQSPAAIRDLRTRICRQLQVTNKQELGRKLSSYGILEDRYTFYAVATERK